MLSLYETSVIYVCDYTLRNVLACNRYLRQLTESVSVNGLAPDGTKPLPELHLNIIIEVP